MSSNAYYAELRPDRALRRLVLATGVALGAAGTLACVFLPLSSPLHLLAGLAWSAGSLHQLSRLRRAWADCRALRLKADGSVAVCRADGRWQPAALLGGGILLRRSGWVRLRGAAGQAWAEPLRGRCRGDQDWRRLQVIWRHVGAAR